MALTPLNKGWYILGNLLQRIISPLVLAILFFIVITPVAVITRIFGRDPLSIRGLAAKKSYWTIRDQKINPESFKDQF